MSEILHLKLHRNFFADIVEGKKHAEYRKQSAAFRFLASFDGREPPGKIFVASVCAYLGLEKAHGCSSFPKRPHGLHSPLL